MKRLIMCAGLLIAMAGVADAQTAKQKGTVKKQQATNGTAVAKKAVRKTGTHAAGKRTSPGVSKNLQKPVAVSADAQPLQVTDPTIRALNERANGNPVNISSSGIVGVPKRAYGFANGRLLLRPADARTTGTMTGSGAVGTGTSPGIINSHGPAMGVNGKSPYAGPGIYSIPITDGNEGARTNYTDAKRPGTGQKQ